MANIICEQFGLEIPVFAFSHSPAVVAAISKAGGFGVLGAVSYPPDELDRALQWIDRECEGKPYGIDLIIPATYVGSHKGGLNTGEVAEKLPTEHQHFVAHLMEKYNIPPLATARGRDLNSAAAFTAKGAFAQLEIAFKYQIKLIVNALGVPPADLIERAHAQNIKVGALVGTVPQAIQQKKAGVDLIIAQGYEAGGHTGEIATMVLIPQVVDAVAPVPVLAAGGIASGRQLAAAFALGAQGAWTGSVWLTTAEAETHPVVKEKFLKANSSDTLRSRSRTGKPARQLRSSWTDEWDAPQNPKPLPMPLQSLLTEEAWARIGQDATNGGRGGTELVNYFVGQVVGMLNEVKPAAEVLQQMMTECKAVLQNLKLD